MCESEVMIVRKNGNMELFMEDVLILKVEDTKIKLFGVLGDSKEIFGRIKEVNLAEHRVLVEEI